MHYYTFNIGDYVRDTAHLDEMEDLAYRRMLDLYYLRESPLPKDIKEISKLIRMRTHCESIANVLQEYFTLTDAGYVNSKADSTLSKIYDKSDKAKKSAEKRWSKQQVKNANALPTDSERNADGMLPINPLPINPLPNNTVVKRDSQQADDSQQIFEYWCLVMQKSSAAKFTADRKRAVKARLKEGYTIEHIKQAIDGCSRSDFHMGRDGKNTTKFDDLELICRSGSQLEKFALNIGAGSMTSGILNGYQEFVSNE